MLKESPLSFLRGLTEIDPSEAWRRDLFPLLLPPEIWTPNPGNSDSGALERLVSLDTRAVWTEEFPDSSEIIIPDDHPHSPLLAIFFMPGNVGLIARRIVVYGELKERWEKIRQREGLEKTSISNPKRGSMLGIILGLLGLRRTP